MKIHSIPTIALLVGSSAAAFGLGWVLKPESPAPRAARDQAPLASSLLGVSSTIDQDAIARDTSAKRSRPASPISEYLAGNGEMTPENMASAIKAMAGENDPLKKSAMMTALLEQLTPENAKSAFEALRESRGNRRGRGGDDETRLLLNAWGRIDGEGAIAEITAMAEKERAEREARGETDDRGGRGGRGWDRDGGSPFDIHNILSGWAMTDSGAALEYVNSLEGDDRRKDMYTRGIVDGLMAKGVDEAVDFISSLPKDENGSRGHYMATVAEEMLEKGVDSAAQWATSLGDDDLKGGAMNRIAAQYAREDLDAAIAWVSEHSSEDYARSAVTEVAEEWAERDPQAVLEWAADLPSESQRRVFQEALDEWTERDPRAASEYLANMPSSEVKDSAVQGFARELAREDPPSAAVWASTIGNEEVRTSTLLNVARDWVRTDRQALEEWLPQSGLTPEAQQSVLEVRPDRGRGGWEGFRGGRGR